MLSSTRRTHRVAALAGAVALPLAVACGPAISSRNSEPGPDREETLFRIAQEAVNNAIKYASAKSIRVSFEHDTKSLKIVIEDDGKGFDLKKIKIGNGLKNIDERVFSMEGSISRITNEGSGTKIQMEVPIT